MDGTQTAEAIHVPGYQLHSRIGSGGMGVVYYATRPDCEYKYAIKMLLAGREATVETVARFRAEAEAYACLQHPQIIRIRAVGVASGCPYIAMDYAEHGSLDGHIRRNPHLGPEWQVATAVHVADALSHAHSRGILHRDLKPANILIFGDSLPRVTDFGLVKFSGPRCAEGPSWGTIAVEALDEHLSQLALGRARPAAEHGGGIDGSPSNRSPSNRSTVAGDDRPTQLETAEWLPGDASGITTAPRPPEIDGDDQPATIAMGSTVVALDASELLANLTQHGTIVGTPNFMSPEQATGDGGQLGPHTDVYGLGATLYYTLTGVFPIAGRTAWEVVRNVPTHKPPRPDEIDGRVGEDLGLVVMKAIAKRPTDRYATMDAFRDDLRRVLAGEKTLARRRARARFRPFLRSAASMTTKIYKRGRS